MSKGYVASDYSIMKTGVSFISDDPKLKSLFDRCEECCTKNLAVFTDKKVLREGSDYDGVWLETQPMGGEMYAKRDVEAALNNQLIFMENQRKSGRLPGMIKFGEPFLLQVSYDWLQGYCFPTPALNMYYLIGRDRGYLEKLYDTLKSFDDYLWTYRDSDGDGCLESWCTWDTGEDNSLRFTRFGVKDGGHGGEFPPSEDSGLPFESMDIMSYSCEGREILGKISDLLGNGEGERWRRKAQEVRDKIREYLWVDEKNACYDRDSQNRVMDVLTHNNLRCMYYGSFSQDMADRFVKNHLMNREEFWTEVPLPSIAANDPCFRNIDFNNWGGQPEGLTYQRAIQALERYGHETEIRMLGKKWIELLIRTGRLVQQYDPFTGKPCRTRAEGLAPEGEETERYAGVTLLDPDGYGPTILAALEYISLLCGVNIAQEKVRWSAAAGMAGSIYTQHMYDHDYCLTQDGAEMTASIDGQVIFRASTGIQVTTDLYGRVEEIAGIEESPVNARLAVCGDNNAAETIKEYTGEIHPNEKAVPEKEGFRITNRVPFDLPFTVGKQ